MKFNSLIPELSVTNITFSTKFYVLLGFNVKYERKENKFVFLEYENNQIMIEEVNNNWSVGELSYPFGNGINLSMEVSDIDALYQKVKKLDIHIFRELKVSEYKVDDEVYQDKEFLIQDPDGYLLRFTSWLKGSVNKWKKVILIFLRWSNLINMV